MVRNYVEDIVDRMVPNIIKKYPDVCKCSICVDDIKAIVLNNMKPQYVVTEKGELFTKTNELVNQYEMDLVKEIALAIKTVSQNPRHK